MTIKKLSIMDFNQLFSSLKPNTKKVIVTPMLILLSLLLVIILGTVGFLRALVNPNVAQANTAQACEVITLTSGTNTKTGGWTATDPVASPLNTTMYSGAGFSGSYATETVIPPWVNPATDSDFSGSGALWVSSDDSWPGGSGNTEGIATTSQWRLFQDSFILPVGAVVASATIWYSADNAASVYLNGNNSAFTTTGDVFGATPVSGPANYGDVFTASFTPAAGTNTLDFVVRNWSTDGTTNPTGLLYKAVVNYCVPVAEEDNTVTIVKYIDGVMATAATANNADFPMSATWDADNLGAGTGGYALSELGFNGDPTPYKAVTAEMDAGADYSTHEILTGSVVGATCAAYKPFALTGYTTGNTLALAAAATPTTTHPSFTNIQDDKYVIVWNDDCATPTPTPTPTTTVTVTIVKYVQGMMATSGSASNADFPMTATWDADNIGTGTASYVLSETNTMPYKAVTSAMTIGADYSTKEKVNTSVVGAQCVTGKPFALKGYTTGNTLALAAMATPTMAMPSFTNLQTNKYVIVWNRDCSKTDTNGNIGGDVVGPHVVLRVTSIDMIDTTATANGTFSDGWKYVFHITAPMTEQNLAMKFSDWLRTGGGGTIPVANNMRISSAQANNGGATVLLTAANTYSTPALTMTGDLNAVMPGRQVEITVEVAIPNSTPIGAYTTSYGVQSSL